MKKIIAILCNILMIASLAACRNDEIWKTY